jgi:glyoxylase-like metal-dependent hydrolase (beta-lactamase superfamily II)
MASLAATQPPIAPAPTTQMFMAAPMGYKAALGQGGRLMLFRQLFEPNSSAYTYLIACDQTREAALIDPVLETVERDLQLLAELGLTLKYTIETHIHADHVTGAARLREETGCKAAVPEKSAADHVDVSIRQGETIEVGTLRLEPLYTPGHTDDHHVYVLHTTDGSRVFTGDALMIDGCGRTDFQNGDAATLYRSVHEKIFALPEDTLVYPGHDYQQRRVSSVGQERARNPRLGGGKSVEEFVAIMDGLNLPRPKKMDIAVPANLECGEVDVQPI